MRSSSQQNSLGGSLSLDVVKHLISSQNLRRMDYERRGHLSSRCKTISYHAFENRFRIELVNAWDTVINTREYYLNHVLSLERRKSKEVRIRFGQGWDYVDIAFKKADDSDLFIYFMNALF